MKKTVFVVVEEGRVTEAYTEADNIDIEVIDMDDINASKNNEYVEMMRQLKQVRTLRSIY